MQIEKDLHRTFPGHELLDAAGRAALRRVLAAYAMHNPGVGYCQVLEYVFCFEWLQASYLGIEKGCLSPFFA